jgi:ABC-type lipoprotein export system ATPase subunit
MVMEARGVRKEYPQPGQSVVALRDLSLKVEQGEMLSITGESGSGKSTLISLLGALDRPTRGDVLYRGESLASAGPERLSRLRLERFGFVFQEFHLVRHMTVEDNVRLPLALQGSVNGMDRVRALAHRVGLDGRARRRPDELSIGERQRVALARALVNRPEILFADEPTASLDRRNADIIWDLMESLNREEGLTVVVATHNMELASRASRVISLRDGAIDADP